LESLNLLIAQFQATFKIFHMRRFNGSVLIAIRENQGHV
jgi:hypothetical protein